MYFYYLKCENSWLLTNMLKSKLPTCFDNTQQLRLPVDVKRHSLTLLLTDISLLSALVDIGSHKEQWDLFGLTGSLA